MNDRGQIKGTREKKNPTLLRYEPLSRSHGRDGLDHWRVRDVSEIASLDSFAQFTPTTFLFLKKLHQ